MGRNYKVDNSKLGRSIELDGLAEGLGKNSNCLLVVECKYRKTPFSVAMLEQLKESVSIFDGYTTIDYYLFSKSGFTPEIMKLLDSSLHFISLDRMFS